MWLSCEAPVITPFSHIRIICFAPIITSICINYLGHLVDSSDSLTLRDDTVSRTHKNNARSYCYNSIDCKCMVVNAEKY